MEFSPLIGGKVPLRFPGCTLGVFTPSAHLTSGLSARASEHSYPMPCGTGPPPDFLWVLQGFSPGPCVQNKPLGFSCLGLRAVLTASRLFTRTGSVASRLSRNPTRNPIPSCTSLFRALPRHPIGHRYQRLSLLPSQRLQGIFPVRQCSRCCHPNLTLLSFSLQGFLPAQSCSHTSAGLPSCRYPCGPDFKVLTLTEQIGLLLNAPCCQKTNAAFPPGVAAGTCTRTIRDALFKLTRSS